MCLSKVTKIYKKPDPKERVGWKVGVLTSEHFIPYFATFVRLKTNKWERAKDDKSENYPLGFHIFTKKLDAKRFLDFYIRTKGDGTIVKVKYRKVVARGVQSLTKRIYNNATSWGGSTASTAQDDFYEIIINKLPCIVAKEMKVIIK